VMEMEADRMVNLGLTEEVVTPERKVILEERDSRTDTNPQALFFEQLYASLYVAHPYRNPVIGWESDMQGLGLEDAIDLYGKKYAPNNAILVVAGDVTAEGVRTLADEIYGAIPRRETYPRRRTPEPPPIAARRVTMTDARAGNPVFARLYLAPSYSTAEGREAYALELFAAILGGGETSRLNQALVKDRQIASSASAWYDGDGLEDRMVGLFGVPMPGTSLADLEAAMTAELEKLAKDGPAPDELERAKTVLRANAIYAQDSQEGLANYYGAGVTLGRPLDELVAWPDRIADVTAEDIKAAAAKYLTMERSVSGTLEPEAASDGVPQPAPAGPPSGGVQ